MDSVNLTVNLRCPLGSVTICPDKIHLQTKDGGQLDKSLDGPEHELTRVAIMAMMDYCRKLQSISLSTADTAVAINDLVGWQTYLKMTRAGLDSAQQSLNRCLGKIDERYEELTTGPSSDSPGSSGDPEATA